MDLGHIIVGGTPSDSAQGMGLAHQADQTTFETIIANIKKGNFPKNDGEKLRTAVYILSDQCKADEDEKIGLLGKLLSKVGVLNLARSEGQHSYMYSRSKIPCLRVTDSDLCLLTNALARVLRQPELATTNHGVHPVELFTKLLLGLNVNMTKFGASSVEFVTASNTPQRAKFILSGFGKSPGVLDFFLDLASNAKTLTSLSLECSSFSKEHLPLYIQIFENNSELKRFSLIDNTLPPKLVHALAKFIKSSQSLERIFMKSNKFASQDDLRTLMTAISENTTLSELDVTAGKQLRQWIASGEIYLFLENIKSHPTLNRLHLDDKVARMVTSPEGVRLIEAMNKTVKYNKALTQINIGGIHSQYGGFFMESVKNRLYSNEIVKKLDRIPGPPIIVSEETMLCSPDLPTELLQKLGKHTLWVANPEDLKRAQSVIDDKASKIKSSNSM